jgi:hypothetical protein
MRTPFGVDRIMRRTIILWLTASAMVIAAIPARAQYVQIQNVEVTPFIGVRFGGTFETQPYQPDVPVPVPIAASSPVAATLGDAQSSGFSAGVRFDDLSVVEFRWTQSTSSLRFAYPFSSLGPSLGEISLNQFHGDFTREFIVPEVKGLRSFLTLSVGATHIGAARDSFTRFSFGFGTGLKQFIGSHLAIRAEAQWLPIWIEPEVGSFGCSTLGASGCFAILTGRTTQQFELSIGPVVRF